jgi:hypothetical protein
LGHRTEHDWVRMGEPASLLPSSEASRRWWRSILAKKLSLTAFRTSGTRFCAGCLHYVPVKRHCNPKRQLPRSRKLRILPGSRNDNPACGSPFGAEGVRDLSLFSRPGRIASAGPNFSRASAASPSSRPGLRPIRLDLPAPTHRIAAEGCRSVERFDEWNERRGSQACALVPERRMPQHMK